MIDNTFNFSTLAKYLKILIFIFVFVAIGCSAPQKDKLSADCSRNLISAVLCPVEATLMVTATALNLGHDPYTTIVQKQTPIFQKQFGAKVQAPVTVPRTENGQTVHQIEEQRLVLEPTQMLVKNAQLSPSVKEQLIAANQDSLKAGGAVKLICPMQTPPKVFAELKSAGIVYEQSYTQDNNFVLVMYKKT
jgi:hypothetical protein